MSKAVAGIGGAVLNRNETPESPFFERLLKANAQKATHKEKKIFF